jgi:antitoxin VapB
MANEFGHISFDNALYTYIRVYTEQDMNAVVHSKTFQSGNSETVRLPKTIGFGPGTDVIIERRGDEVIIRPKRQSIAELARKLLELPAPGEVETRDPDIFSDRAL